MSPETNPLDLGENYRRVLNHHGYGFQYRLLDIIADLRKQRRSDWDLEAAEFPVRVRDMSTRIDFILRKTKPHLYLIAECKRVNPALSNWCFASSIYASGSSRSDKLRFQSAWVPTPNKHLVEMSSRSQATRMLTQTFAADVAEGVYHVGLSVRSTQPGDKFGKNSDAIEEAAGQVCKGVNGLIEYFDSQRLKLPENEKLIFLPVICTTARIWTTTVDLASASIEKGEFESGSVPVKEASWIWYQYHPSPALRHTVAADESEYISPFDLARFLEQEFTQSIAIISVKGIEGFLNHGFPYR